MIGTAAVAAAAAFAGGGLVAQTVVVPAWRAMDPAAFLAQFGTTGPATGATVFPFELAALVLFGVSGYSAVRARRPGRGAWCLATVCMLMTFALLIYFVPTNLAMLDPAFPPHAVPGELAAWYRWDWVRVGAGIAATVLGCVALVADRGDRGDAATRLR